LLGFCGSYKWGFARWSLEKRLNFFETNWAFFAGFGSPCVIATFFFSPLVSAGVMAILFPLVSLQQVIASFFGILIAVHEDEPCLSPAVSPQLAHSYCHSELICLGPLSILFCSLNPASN
jgi:hypothetical protein